MQRLLTMTAAVVLLSLAPVAQAGVLSSVIDTVKSGTLPEVDSPEEAEVCAMESAFMSLAFAGVDGTTQDTLDALDDQSSYWESRAAAINGKTPLEYETGPDYIDTIMALADIDSDTNMKVALACADRIR